MDYYGGCLAAVEELLNDMQYDMVRDKFDDAVAADDEVGRQAVYEGHVLFL